MPSSGFFTISSWVSMQLENYIAITPEETAATLAKELEELGAQHVKLSYKAVYFAADLKTAYTIHLKSRGASRILKVLREAAATSEIILRDQAARIAWDQYLPKNATFLVEGIAGDRGTDAMTSNQISKAVRMGLEEYYRRKNMAAPKVDLKEPSVEVVAFVYKRRVTISLSSSGKAMHKRGYRLEGHPAPLKETLAASILQIAGYDGSQVLLDPMCGSGTIAIEAAYIALNKAPLIHRKKGDFGFESFVDFDRDLWRHVQDEIRSERTEELPSPIFARDVSSQYLDMARNNALRARVEKHIQFETASFFEADAPAESGILITNLPYGERIGNKDEEVMKEFYKDIGNTLKRKYAGWNAFLLAADESPWKFIGLKPKRRIPILNGSIPCKLLMFELYAGKKGARDSQPDADAELHTPQ